MYKGYTNLELYDLFRAPGQREHNFINFLNKIKDKEEPCKTEMNTSQETSEPSTKNDSELNSLKPLTDSLDSVKMEQTSQLMSGTSDLDQLSGMQSDLLEEPLLLEKHEDATDSLVEMNQLSQVIET